jgi:hypothetical protein
LGETQSSNGWSETVIADVKNFGAKVIAIAADNPGDLYLLTSLADGSGRQLLKGIKSSGTYSLTRMPSGADPYAITSDFRGNLYTVSPGANQLLEEPFGPAINLSQTAPPGTGYKTSFVFAFDSPGTVAGETILTQGAPGLDFQDVGTGSCHQQTTSHVYKAGDGCTVDVIFKPRLAGARYGAVVLQDASGNPMATAYVYGVGLQPRSAFSRARSFPLQPAWHILRVLRSMAQGASWSPTAPPETFIEKRYPLRGSTPIPRRRSPPVSVTHPGSLSTALETSLS